MRRSFFFPAFCLILFSCLNPAGYGIFNLKYAGPPGSRDSIYDQILYNGRAWRNLYYTVKGDQFLFSDGFMDGTVTIANRYFTGLVLKYDILNDEILTINRLGIIIQLNKESISEFTLNQDNETYRFQKLDTSASAPFTGFANVLCDGKVSLLVRYRKEILKLSGDSVYMKFKQSQNLYLRTGNKMIPVNNKKDLLDFMNDKRQLVKSFIKNNRLKISRQVPRDVAPVVKYYNTLII